jgi:predicted TIM-barrel fold metal-dependent hydrolase
MLRENGVKMVRMSPQSHGYSMSEWNCGPLYAMLEETGVLLTVDFPQLGYDALHSILTAHPKLRLILTNIHYNCARNIYPLLMKCGNLYLESIGFKVLDGIEDVCRKIGPKNLLFGSMSPVYSASAAIGMITYSDITDEEKQMIACDNLKRLLEGVKL